MNILKTTTSLLLYFTLLNSFSQSVNGNIIDDGSNLPISDAHVFLKRTNIGCFSNEKGFFKLKNKTILYPNDTLHFSIIGYNTKQVLLSELKKNNFTVYLSKKSEQLREVVISGQKKLKKRVPFKKLASLEKGVSNFGSVLIDDTIYVLGGDRSRIDDTNKKALDDIEGEPGGGLQELLNNMGNNYTWEMYSEKLQVYKIGANQWSLSDLDFKKRAYHQMVCIDSSLYVLGGKTLSRNKKKEYLEQKIEVLDLHKKQIIEDDTNPHQAVNFASFSYRDKIIVMGGSIKSNENGDKVYTDASHIYNTLTGYWYALPNMTKPKEVNGIVVQNKIYLIGGFNKKALKEIESYDLYDGKWHKEGALFSGIENPALAVAAKTIYIYSDGKLLSYNTESKILNEYQIDLYSKSSKMHCHNGKIYIVGGFDDFDYIKSSSSQLVVINLNDLEECKIWKTKKLL